MASGFSDFLELELLDHVFSAAAYTAPGTLHFALFTVAPTDSGGGTEVSGSGYARAAVTNNATNFPAASAGAKSNGTAISFGTASGGNWGTVVAVAVFDASTAGNMLAWGDLTVNRTINDGDSAQFNANDFDVTLT